MTVQEVEAFCQETLAALRAVSSREQLEQFRLTYMVQKGRIRQMFDRLRQVPKEEKPLVGRLLNDLRRTVEEEFAALQQRFEQRTEKPAIDPTLPGRPLPRGSLHPVLQTLDRMIDIFTRMGFTVAQGPEVEDDYHNFEALNFPPDHPARDMQDTFFLRLTDSSGKPLLLRTHTSPVQIRLMEAMSPPIRAIMPGRVYRNEAISARSLAEFHQLEGLCIDEHTSFADLKATMITFARQMYGSAIRYRFRPSYFPFTEPSAEMDIECFLCGGKGCRVCKYSGWLEIVGCGMVHPNVLRACNLDPERWQGYAFGFGIERVTMLLTGIDDIRLLYENDIRVLSQF
ncbi:MAG: phenylalanine--tRNA ligase subunit alpha [Bacteroidota bacterium]|nr:phenylalanine--tRNA ligase subunit alpha [Candidatus Kapabacteria bacterium]MCS7302728.1 phenylalanine--tRNA ligase subunit alpha [Candidatus Kapabacteria bacterium]MCX7937055.1 phenylalanine--tRNA ligase subunit alpha [Chlorobiota bacterium]MDW8075154.1 phenylalanine--tRNA ligase subunit alpha [Bacteroidota bacterium]MDW8272385.1 phenylalanine--tRNA ligase subunit alpha [Bacteroidota bacterium]